MSLYEFVADRIRRDRMHPIAVSRVNRAVRVLSRDLSLQLCRPGFDLSGVSARRTGQLQAIQVDFPAACSMVNMYHRHHASPLGHMYSGGVFDGDVMCAAVIAGRPVSRHQDDGRTIELTRVVSDGTRNACSKAMGWALQQARKRGFARAITYTLTSEPGASLRAVGMVPTGVSDGGSWNSRSRRRAPDRHPTGPKIRWEKKL